MRIGISVISHAGQNIWENGMGQNVVFLALALRRLPFVKKVFLIDVGDQKAMPDQLDMGALDLQLVPMQASADAVDVIVEMAGGLDPQWLALQRARGKKVVYYCAGQPYVGLIESSVFDKPGSFAAANRCDEIWVLPKDRQFVPLMRTIHRCPVDVAPYLWSPQFLQQRVAELGALCQTFGWAARQPTDEPRAPGLRVAIFEPNISVVKTCSIPMLACDEAYRADGSTVQMMHVLNTLHMKDHPTLLYLANSLDLVQQHKACFHGRVDIASFMAQHADAVVAHQWENEQNYSYLDALYGDYPLVHNSPWLHEFGAGYYYPGFEAAEAARQLTLAAREHDARLPDQRRAAEAVFAAIDPFSDPTLQAHAQLLRRLCHDRPELLNA